MLFREKVVFRLVRFGRELSLFLVLIRAYGIVRGFCLISRGLWWTERSEGGLIMQSCLRLRQNDLCMHGEGICVSDDIRTLDLAIERCSFYDLEPHPSTPRHMDRNVPTEISVCLGGVRCRYMSVVLETDSRSCDMLSFSPTKRQRHTCRIPVISLTRRHRCP